MTNRLYGLLTYGHNLEGSYYKKLHTPVFPTNNGIEIQKIILSGVPEERIPMLACFLCYEVMFTEFGAEIRELDGNNTYNPVSKNPSLGVLDQNNLLHDLTGPVSDYKFMYRYLADDIVSRLSVPTWLDLMAAGCLQMLRETENS
jgi:hypothetical protein